MKLFVYVELYWKFLLDV